jgi:Sec-independent protein translocase protein TatA
MEILGVGILEILLVAGLAFVVIGPEDLTTLSRKAGAMIRKWLSSDEFREIERAKDALNNLPMMVLQETGLDENSIAAWTDPVANQPTGNRIPAGSAETISPNPVLDDQSDDPLSAWANPGGTPNEKKTAMLASVKQASVKQASIQQAQENRGVTPDPNPAPKQTDSPPQI